MVEYSEQVANDVCRMIAEGMSLRQIARVEGLPAMSSVCKWLGLHPEFAEQYARARELQAERFADDIIEIADDKSEDVYGELEMPNSVAVARAKLRIDSRKWIASKLLPKKYGDKLQTEVSGPDGGPIAVTVDL